MSEQHRAYLILGATGSVGEALARRLQSAGDPVMLAARNADAVAELGESLDLPTTVVEATRLETIEDAVARTVDEFGRIDGVAHCIGSVLLKPAHSTSDEEWNETLAVNLTSAFALLRSAARRMRNQGGSIVFASSAAAQIGIPNHEAIAAAKAGIMGLTVSAAASYAARGIRVNAVAPGLVKSKMTRSIWSDDASAESSIAMHALGRLGEPDEVAAAMQWLLGADSQWVTGQVLGVDGGLGRVVPRIRK